MMIMTAKVDLKKIILGVALVAVLLIAAITLMGGSDVRTTPANTLSVSGNDGRVRFLKDFGWDVTPSPLESSQVKIPTDSSDVFSRYNLMQKGQGYDLSQYAGKNVMRYVYQINNYPGSAEPVYATLLIHENQVIGGDITDPRPGGKIRGFKMPEPASTAPVTTSPAAGTATESVPGST